MSSPLLWAIYLGMSWTWVIGMFLPVLLVRDYGQLAWWVFAIPNVIGAGAMGWVMRSREQSERVVTTHADACRLFSLVTIAFHLFFAIWMLPQIAGNAGWLVAAVVVQLAFTPILRGKGALIACVVVLLGSVTVALLMAQQGLLALPKARVVGVGDLTGLSLVCLLGFLTCPYLDLTFHRARRSTSDSGAKVAFGLGFGVFFASMIVLTLFYALHLQHPKWSPLLAVHMGLQMALTVSLHARTLIDHAEQRDDVANFRASLGAALALGMAGGMVAYFGRYYGLGYSGLPVGEIVYRVFMSFYGLLFPAYVLTSLFNGAARWRATLLSVVLAIPFFWLAFIERQMAFATVGVVVVLAIAAWRRFASQQHEHRAGSGQHDAEQHADDPA